MTCNCNWIVSLLSALVPPITWSTPEFWKQLLASNLDSRQAVVVKESDALRSLGAPGLEQADVVTREALDKYFNDLSKIKSRAEKRAESIVDKDERKTVYNAAIGGSEQYVIKNVLAIGWIAKRYSY